MPDGLTVEVNTVTFAKGLAGRTAPGSSFLRSGVLCVHTRVRSNEIDARDVARPASDRLPSAA